MKLGELRNVLMLLRLCYTELHISKWHLINHLFDGPNLLFITCLSGMIMESICDMWLSPEDTSRLNVAPLSVDDRTVDEQLEEQYAKLEVLKLQIADLHQQL